MIKLLATWLRTLALLLATTLGITWLPSLADARPVTIADSIEMNRLLNPAAGLGSDGSASILLSPDAQHFVLLLRHGNSDNNTNEYTLQIWRSRYALSKRAADQSITLSSSSNRPGIQSVNWLRDNETVLFLGEEPGKLHQLYSFDIKSGRLRQLSQSPTNVVSYDASADGHTIVIATEESPKAVWDSTAIRQGLLVVPELAVQDVIAGKYDPSDPRFCDYVQLFLLRITLNQSSQKRIADRIKMLPGDPLALSPDAEHVLLPAMVETIPESWRQYQDPLIQRLTRNRVRPGQYSVLKRYAELSTTTGALRVLIDAPIDLKHRPSSAWSPSGRSVVLTNTYLPIEPREASTASSVLRESATVELNLLTGQVARISSDKLVNPIWDAGAGEVTFTSAALADEGSSRISFHRTERGWERIATSSEGPAAADGQEFRVKEGLNTPPHLIESTGGAEQDRLVFNPNPQFSRLTFGRVRLVHWRTADGFQETGGLYYPVGYTADRRYPLVIQTHGFDPRRFWIDGPYATGFCAQELAGRKIMVLQAAEDPREFDSYKGILNNVSMLKAAIDYLNTEGLIDIERIGLIGFSHTAPEVAYALSGGKYHIAAAAFADAVDSGYLLYLFDNTPDYQRSIELSLGGPPFTANSLETWIKRSPSFNMNNINTPVRIVAASPTDLLYEWDWLSGLKRLSKPVDMVVLRDGAHDLQRPWERTVSQEGNLDWFTFWLQGYEDPDPGKASQYRRWEGLCTLQKAADSQRQTFCATPKQ